MIFRLIEAKKAEHAISRLCRVLGVTRAGYYAWRSRRPSRRELADQELSGLIGRVFVESLETYGAQRVRGGRGEGVISLVSVTVLSLSGRISRGDGTLHSKGGIALPAPRSML
jgi:hypothetical protein